MRKLLNFLQNKQENSPIDSNDRVMPPTSGTWVEPRDSVMTIMFNRFGGGPYRRDEDLGSGFSDAEKISLAMAVRKTVEISSIIIEASRCRFRDDDYLLKKWFGLNYTEVGFRAGVTRVVDGVNRMHQVLSDNTKQLRFVDRRNQNLISCSTDYRTVFIRDSANQWVPRGEKAVVRDLRTVPPEAEEYAGIYQLKQKFRGPDNSPHVGSGYCIYVCPYLLRPGIKMGEICETLYHEMTHKVLDTNDVTSDHSYIYSGLECRQLARKSSDEALKIANCWSYFFMEFYRL